VLSPKLILQLTRSFVRDVRMRRTLMFYLALGAMLTLFAGAVLLDATLRAHPFIFLGYWAVCGWLTLAAMLLAIFDLLAVRAAAREARRKLARDLFSQDHDLHPR
jgi:hypothetical protein